MDKRISSYSAPLTSSVTDYPEEYAKATGKLFLAPVEKGKTHRIVDVGTGTGIWAVEAGDAFPNAEVAGIDPSAIQPNFVPPNVKFEINDGESPWVGDVRYNFIFTRHMACSIADWPRPLRNDIYTSLNNNGWAEFQDYELMFKADDGTLTDDHETMKWIKPANEVSNKVGRELNPGPKLYN
ncbi:hypothetical protein LX36DRAFT_673671 [Colletotrichum falcatum]|nr:hypothetical protein LX36DRAFT_673671 [Colletotrichum falcatum]